MNGSSTETERAARPVAPLAILDRKLEALVDRSAGVPGLDADFGRALRDAQRLAGGLEPYTQACTTPESTALAALQADTRAIDWTARHAAGDTAVALEQEMLSGHVEGQFLKFLLHAMQARRVLEIGLFTGYSALAMAEALPESGELVACELDAFAAEVARAAFARSPHGAKIRIELGDARATMKRLRDAGECFDLVFIDADKAGYATYLDIALEGSLLAAHGVVCVDNTLMQGEPWLPGEPTANGRAIAAFNRALIDDPRVEQVMLPLRDGITLIRRAGVAVR